MRYYWQLLAAIMGITAIIILFFALSVPVRNNVSFTGVKEVTAPEITSADPSIGPTTAKVTIVEYGDYECPACAELEQNLTTLRNSYGTSLRVVWKDMPNSQAHTEAVSAAVAARCAEKQNAFWQFHNTLMTNQPLLSPDFYTQTATDLKLKMNAFTQCVQNQQTLPLVERGYDEGIALHVTATPTIFINSVRYTGDLTPSELKRTIDSLLK